jgi:phage terminase Nu1 subunit (DNA packaging protein)
MTTERRPLEVDRRTLADVLGVSVRHLATLEADGVITAQTRGRGGRASLFSLPAAVQAYVQHLTAVVTDDASPREARRRKDLAQARLTELRYDRERGELVSLAVATREAFNSSRITRDSILNVPARLSAELASITDASQVHLRLDAALRQALQTISAAIRNQEEEIDEHGTQTH